jgi:serine/threonine protein kinase
MENRRIVQRFLTEARIITSLRTDHVVRVLETADPGSSLPYIAMERLHGRDLRRHLRVRNGARLSLAEADDLLRQIARGIDAAHGADIVHRDLKPSNLFRDDTGTWKILDFGVSKVIGEHTAEHAVVGTPSFMSPEQLKGGTVDGRTDIFALGAIMYYVVTGKLAFAGDTLAAVALQVTHDAPRLPSDLVPGIPPGIDDAVMTALAKDPQKRFATAAAFSEAFSAAIAVRRPDSDREPSALHSRAASAPGAGSEPGETGHTAQDVEPLASQASMIEPEAVGAAPLCTLLIHGRRRQRELIELPAVDPQNDEIEIAE